jgi:hypothetical protein
VQPRAAIHLAHCGRGGMGGLCLGRGLCLRPHPPCPSAGRGSLRMCLRLGLRWVIALDVPLTRACWLPEFPVGRPWLPTTLYFDCFGHFRRMF